MAIYAKHYFTHAIPTLVDDQRVIAYGAEYVHAACRYCSTRPPRRSHRWTRGPDPIAGEPRPVLTVYPDFATEE